jgi:hypothetical protein
MSSSASTSHANSGAVQRKTTLSSLKAMPRDVVAAPALRLLPSPPSRRDREGRIASQLCSHPRNSGLAQSSGPPAPLSIECTKKDYMFRHVGILWLLPQRRPNQGEIGEPVAKGIRIVAITGPAMSRVLQGGLSAANPAGGRAAGNVRWVLPGSPILQSWASSAL